MVSALLVALLVAGEPDSSAVQDVEREETAVEEGETGLALEDDDARAAGRFVIAGGAYALRTALAWRRVGLDALLAREPGEWRAIDDAHVRLSYTSRAFNVIAGRVQVERGAGLALGAPRVGNAAPSLPAREAVGALSSTPARAASGFTGVWIERPHAGFLLARTRRDARPVGDALLPLAGVRHRDARGDSARGALTEDAAALALSAGPAWLVLAHARSSPYRVPPSGATAAEQRAATIVDASSVLEIGGRARPAPGAVLEGALAFDAQGRARSSTALEIRAPRTRTVLAFESEATGFVPLRARPEHRPHAHASVLVRTGAARFEAHAVERRAYETPRMWATFRTALARGAWAELRRDADPVRTIVALAVPLERGVLLASEWRFDRHGLARETWRARAFGRLPRGFVGGVELRFSGARTSVAWLDAEVPGGAWAGAGTGTERARLEVGRPGRVEPRLSWVRTRTASGTRSEARLAVTWSTRKESP